VHIRQNRHPCAHRNSLRIETGIASTASRQKGSRTRRRRGWKYW
jgi:hypothetical protein